MLKLIFLFLAVSASLSQAQIPNVKSGDIIFQTSDSPQSNAIQEATGSLFSHVGIVKVSKNKKVVIEAVSKVKPTPLEEWIARGRDENYVVYRDNKLTDKEREQVVNAAESYLGRPYNLFFTFHSDAIYCSELVYFAFQKIGINIGHVQKIRELNVENSAIQQLVKKRWKDHPLCKGVSNMKACWNIVLNDDIITPASISEDSRLGVVFNTYP